jgi:excisionase family DNA binding protein
VSLREPDRRGPAVTLGAERAGAQFGPLGWSAWVTVVRPERSQNDGPRISGGSPGSGDGIRTDDLLHATARDVAELLQLPTSTIYELARTGRLPCLRIGRAVRFYQGDLERHLGNASSR